MVPVIFWLFVIVAAAYLFRYAVVAAFKADSAERKRFAEFADRVEGWLKGVGSGNDGS